MDILVFLLIFSLLFIFFLNPGVDDLHRNAQLGRLNGGTADGDGGCPLYR